jgi:hypothetical protein
MELDVGEINQLINTINNSNNILRFTIIFRLCLMLVRTYLRFAYLLLSVGEGKLLCVQQE